MQERSAPQGSELKRVSMDLSEPGHDIWQLMIQTRSLKDQLNDFESDCKRAFSEQMSTLDGLMRWCDYLLYLSSEIYSKRAREERETPEDQ